MVQDIAPAKFYNQYNRKKLHNEARILIFDFTYVLVKNNENKLLELPDFKWLKSILGENEQDYLYAFSIDETDYFIYCSYKKENEDKIKKLKHKLNEVDDFYFEKVRFLRQIDSKMICFAAITGFHLFSWYKDNQFCGRCGKRVVCGEDERRLDCPECGNIIFPKIAPAVIVGLYSGDKILLTKYNATREYKKYALIAGFTEIGETVEETVAREVEEEVGLKVKNIRYYKSQPWGVDSNLLLGFFAELDGDENITLDESELSKAEWFTRDEMPAHDDGFSLTREMMAVFENQKFFEKFIKAE